MDVGGRTGKNHRVFQDRLNPRTSVRQALSEPLTFFSVNLFFSKINDQTHLSFLHFSPIMWIINAGGYPMLRLKDICNYWREKLGWHKTIYAFLLSTAMGNTVCFFLTWMFLGEPQTVSFVMLITSVETLIGYLAMYVGWEQGLEAWHHAGLAGNA
jgi:hypothetical protein